jgi:hypothetical protein
MPVSLFTTLEKEFNSTGFEKRSIEAKDWFIQRVKELNGRINRKALLNDDKVQQRSKAIWGNMYMFAYDPKFKEELPYYDRFPLVLVIGPATGGFLGLNLHYLHPKIRAKFLDKLLGTITDDKLTERTRLKIRYSLLVSVRRLREFAPCLKHYLTGHMKTRPSQVFAPDWETAIFLPTEHFKGGTKTQIWLDSRKQYSAR